MSVIHKNQLTPTSTSDYLWQLHYDTQLDHIRKAQVDPSRRSLLFSTQDRQIYMREAIFRPHPNS